MRNKIYPAIQFKISYIETDERRFVICVDIPVYRNDVVIYKDNSSGQVRERIYRRYPGSTYELTSINEIISYGTTKRKASYDIMETEYNATDYTFNALNEKYKESTNSEKDLTIKELKSVGLITDDNKLSIAGMYFADNCPEQYPAIHLRKWPGFNKGSDEVIDAKELKLNLINQLNEAEKFIRNNSKTGLIKAPGGAKDKWSYPSIAITEALCNAIGHRDYMIPGTQIDVDIYQDRIEIVSPGSFLPEGKAQDYLDISKIPSKRRNEAITDTLAMCKLMQRYGSGFEKILEAYAPYGKEYQPKVSSENNWFTITLMDIAYKKEEKFAAHISADLTGNQKTVFETIKNNPGLNRPQIANKTGLTVLEIKNAIEELNNKNLIMRNSKSKKTGGYVIKN